MNMICPVCKTPYPFSTANTPCPWCPEQRFGAVAIQQVSTVTEAVILEALTAQPSEPPKPLGTLLREMGVLSAAQVVAILQVQGITVLSCASCQRFYNLRGVKSAPPHADYLCPTAACYEVLAVAAAPLPPDTYTYGGRWRPPVVDGFTLRERLGEGGMGRVFCARQERLGRNVALKLLHPKLILTAPREAVEDFADEIRTHCDATRGHPPGIVPIYVGGTVPDPITKAAIPFYAMGLVEGGKPITVYAQQHRLTVRQRLDLFLDVCEAVTVLHGANVIHRDLTPSNLLVDAQQHPWVVDFGLARVWGVAGTREYMSPEACEACEAVGPPSDVYALGVILYELLAGQRPYAIPPDASGEDLYRAILHAAPAPLTQYDPALTEIVNQTLAKDPAARPTVAALRRNLEDYLRTRDAVDSLIRFHFNDFPSNGQSPPPSFLLRAEYGVVPFWGRSTEKNAIIHWCESGRKFEAKFLCGPAGIGKTRLMREICLTLKPKGWATGFARSDEFARAEHAVLRSLYSYPMPMLVVFDYAEGHHRLDSLLELGKEKRDGYPLRFVFVFRQLEEWYENLKMYPPDNPLYNMISTFSLDRLEASPINRRKLFRSARHAFALALGKKEAVLPTSPDFRSEIFERPLFIHIAALLSILGEDEPTTDGDRLLSCLSQHEQTYWQALAQKFEVPNYCRGTIAPLVVINTLLGGVPNEQTLRFISWKLRKILDLDRTELRKLCHVVYECYKGSTGITPLQPDLLGEALVAEVLKGHERLLVGLVGAVADNPAAVGAVLKVLNRIAEAREEGAIWIEEVLASDLVRFAPHALSVAKDAGGPIGRCLVEKLQHNPNPQLAKALEPLLPAYTLALLELRVVVVKQCLQALRESSVPNDKIERARLSSKLGAYLFDLYALLSDLEDLNGAVAAILEANKIYEELIARGRDDYRPHRARNLSNLAIIYSQLGNRTEAIENAKLAVDLYEQLAKNSDEVTIELAHSEDHLALILWEAGHQKRAVHLMQDAIKRYDKLQRTEPSKFRAELAMCHYNLGKFFFADSTERDLGAARKATFRAVNLYKELVSDHLDAFSSYLVESLTLYASGLCTIGDYDQARTEAKNAIQICQGLVKQRPKVFTRYLAKAFNTLALTQLQHAPEEACKTAAKAVRTLLPFYNHHGNDQPLMSTLVETYKYSVIASGKSPTPDLASLVDHFFNKEQF